MSKTYTKAILRLSKKDDYLDTFDLKFDLETNNKDLKNNKPMFLTTELLAPG